jgi:hypothetical protein
VLESDRPDIDPILKSLSNRLWTLIKQKIAAPQKELLESENGKGRRGYLAFTSIYGIAGTHPSNDLHPSFGVMFLIELRHGRPS